MFIYSSLVRGYDYIAKDVTVYDVGGQSYLKFPDLPRERDVIWSIREHCSLLDHATLREPPHDEERTHVKNLAYKALRCLYEVYSPIKPSIKLADSKIPKSVTYPTYEFSQGKLIRALYNVDGSLDISSSLISALGRTKPVIEAITIALRTHEPLRLKPGINKLEVLEAFHTALRKSCGSGTPRSVHRDITLLKPRATKKLTAWLCQMLSVICEEQGINAVAFLAKIKLALSLNANKLPTNLVQKLLCLSDDEWLLAFSFLIDLSEVEQ